MKLGLITSIAALLVGCVSGTLTEPSACETKAMQLSSPVPINAPTHTTISTSIPLDLSGHLKDLSDLGSLSVQSARNTFALNGDDFEWLDQITVSIQSDTMQSLTLVDYSLTDSDKHSSTLTVSLSNTDKLLGYLYSSNPKLVLQATGTVSTTSTGFNNTFCVGIGDDVSKSL